MIKNKDIKIIYEDKNLVVIDKPAGLISHPKNKKDISESVASWLLTKYPEIKNIGEDPLRPGLVHRLDKETSGLLIVAKTNEAFFYLKNLFKERRIKKGYLALVYGKLKNQKGQIRTPLGKIGTKQTIKIIGKKQLKPREALTEYEVIKELDNYSFLRVFPQTGRTHQIRIHLSSIGHPIVCDKIYAFKKSCPASPGRLFLHAYKLEFVTPDNKSIVVESDLPEDLQSFTKSHF